MSEILSAVRLKERVLILIVTFALALLVGGSAGAVTYATTDRHEHDYKYTLVMDEAGEFSLVGRCSYDGCSDPDWSGTIDKTKFITSAVTKNATCCEQGITSYYFTWSYNHVTYVYNEAIPASPHTYVGKINFADDGTASVQGMCTNDGCTNQGLFVNGITEVQKVETIPATCGNPNRVEKYVVNKDGESIEVTTYTEENIEHTLNGKNISEYLLEEGVYKFGIEGMIPLYSTDIGCGQTTAAKYTCEGCQEEFNVRVGKPAHAYVYDSADNILPTLEADGRATVKCTNEGCDYSLYVTLPKATEGVNTVEIGNDHKLEERYLKYTFTSEEYGFNIEIDFTVYWNAHEFVLSDAIEYPTLHSDGTAYVNCTYAGCGKEISVTLPKVVIDSNAVIVSPATEKHPQRFKYTYVDGEFGFAIEFENFMGDKLSHNYVYELVGSGSIIDPTPVLVGKCEQLECDEPEIHIDDVVLSMRDIEATCTELACLEYSCVYGGNTYYYRMPISGSYYAHEFVIDSLTTVNPTDTQAGSATLKCTLCEATKSFELPTVEVNETADNYSYNPATNIETVVYTYVYEYNGDIFTVEHVFERVKPHTHQFEYRLELNSSIGFDFIGACTVTGCSEVYCEYDVDAQLISDTSTCTEPGVQTYEYVFEGVPYQGVVHVLYPVGHSHTAYDVNASTTLLPTLNSAGHIDIKCSACGAHGGTVELPPAVLGEGGNTVLQMVTDEDQDLYKYTYTVVFEGTEITVSALILLPKQN